MVLAAREHATLRGREPELAGDRIGGAAVVVMLRSIVLIVDLHAFEVALHDEVHNTRQGVGAVDRSGAAGQHVHALNERCGDQVKVGSR